MLNQRYTGLQQDTEKWMGAEEGLYRGLRRGCAPTSDAEDIIVSQGLLLYNRTGEI